MTNIRLKWSLALIALLALALPPSDARPAAGQIAGNPDSPEPTVRGVTMAASPERWDLIRIKASEARQLTIGGKDILIAVLDTGIDESHPDLAGKVIDRINLTRSLTANDRNGHGTHIAGIIAADGNNSNGAAGLASNSRILSIKVAEDDGSCDPLTIARGIRLAADSGVNVINLSLALRQPSPALEAALDYAWGKGILIVAAAGNSFTPALLFPAAYPNVIAVSATDGNDNLPLWANRGDWVAVSAPGVDIYSTLPKGRYAGKSGTSYAAALVSAEAALLMGIATDRNGDGKTNDEVFAAIREGCEPIPAAGSGTGRINILKAFAAIGAVLTSKP